MKRYLIPIILLALLLFAPQAHAQQILSGIMAGGGAGGGTPTLVQYVDMGMFGYVSGATPANANVLTATVPLPNNTLSNNCVLVLVYYSWPSGSPTVSGVTDSQSNSYSHVATWPDATNGVNVEAWVAAGVTAGANNVKVTFSANACFVEIKVAELYNVATSSPVDVYSSTSSGRLFSSATTISSPAITTGYANDFVFQFAAQDSVYSQWNNSFIFTKGTNFNLVPGSTQSIDGSCLQYYVKPTAGAITPSMTVGSAMTGITLSIALKYASAGTAPAAGVHVNSVQHTYWNQSVTTNTALAIQRVSTGNLQILLSSLAPGDGSGTVSGGSSGTWNKRIIENVNPPVNCAVGIYDAVNQSALSETLSISFKTLTDTIDMMVLLLDVSGANTAPYDKSGGANGNQTNTASTTLPDGSGNLMQITPSTSNGLVVAVMGLDYDYINGGSGATTSLVTWQTPAAAENGNGDDPCDNSDGWGLFYNANTNPITFTWSVPSGTAVQTWAAAAAAYKH